MCREDVKVELSKRGIPCIWYSADIKDYDSMTRLGLSLFYHDYDYNRPLGEDECI